MHLKKQHHPNTKQTTQTKPQSNHTKPTGINKKPNKNRLRHNHSNILPHNHQQLDQNINIQPNQHTDHHTEQHLCRQQKQYKHQIPLQTHKYNTNQQHNLILHKPQQHHQTQHEANPTHQQTKQPKPILNNHRRLSQINTPTSHTHKKILHPQQQADRPARQQNPHQQILTKNNQKQSNNLLHILQQRDRNDIPHHTTIHLPQTTATHKPQQTRVGHGTSHTTTKTATTKNNPKTLTPT